MICSSLQFTKQIKTGAATDPGLGVRETESAVTSPAQKVRDENDRAKVVLQRQHKCTSVARALSTAYVP